MSHSKHGLTMSHPKYALGMCTVLQCHIHRRQKRGGGGFGGAIIINRRCAHAQGYSSCVSGSRASVGPENAVTYSASNRGQTICGGFSKTAPLQRSNTPSAKGHTKSRQFSCGRRSCVLCPNSTYAAPRVLHFSASYMLCATLDREPIFWGGFSPKAPRFRRL